MTQTKKETSKSSSTELPAGFHQFAPAPATQGDWIRARSPREVIERAILVITLIALGLAVLVFLWAVNEFIAVWFRSQWAPVARGIASLLVILACLFVLQRLLGRRRP